MPSSLAFNYTNVHSYTKHPVAHRSLPFDLHREEWLINICHESPEQRGGGNVSCRTAGRELISEAVNPYSQASGEIKSEWLLSTGGKHRLALGVSLL